MDLSEAPEANTIDLAPNSAPLSARRFKGTLKEVVDPHILHDSKASLSCDDTVELLRHMFSLANGSERAERVYLDEITAHLKPYTDRVGCSRQGENSCCRSFCILISLLNKLSSEVYPDMTSCRNDSSTIRGVQDNTRCPDVVCVSSDRSKWKACADGDRPNVNHEQEAALRVFELRPVPPIEEHTCRDKLQPPRSDTEIEREAGMKSMASTSDSPMISFGGLIETKLSKPPSNSKKRSHVEPEEPGNKRRRTEATEKRDRVKQLCRFTIDIMSEVDNGAHFTNAFVAGTHVWFCYFHRLGVAHSSSIPLNASTEFYQTIRLSTELDNLDYASLLFCESTQNLPIVLKTGGTCWTLNVGNSTFTLSGKRAIGLLGRRTRILQRNPIANDIHRMVLFEMLRPIYELTIFCSFMRTHQDIFRGKYMCANDQWGKADRKANESSRRLGTRAFLPLRFHEGKDVAHLERYDLESTFYVLVWIVTRYESGKGAKTDALKYWANSDDSISLGAKNMYLTYLPTRPKVITHEALYLHWIHPLSVLFAAGITARNNSIILEAPFDNETMDGSVTFEKLWSILRKDLPGDNLINI